MARRVDEPQQHAAAEDGLLHRVPGGAGDVGDDGPLVSRQGVEEGGFSRIGPAHDGAEDPVLHSQPPALGGAELLQGVGLVSKDLRHRLHPEGVQILVGVVQHRVEVGGQVHQGAVDGLCPAEESP